MVKTAVLVCAFALMAPVANAASSLLPNGDFEQESPQSPPPGWTMWGASKYKDPKNFTRDTGKHSSKPLVMWER